VRLKIYFLDLVVEKGRWLVNMPHTFERKRQIQCYHRKKNTTSMEVEDMNE